MIRRRVGVIRSERGGDMRTRWMSGVSGGDGSCSRDRRFPRGHSYSSSEHTRDRGSERVDREDEKERESMASALREVEPVHRQRMIERLQHDTGAARTHIIQSSRTISAEASSSSARRTSLGRNALVELNLLLPNRKRPIAATRRRTYPSPTPSSTWPAPSHARRDCLPSPPKRPEDLR